MLLASPTEGDKTLGVTGCVSHHPEGSGVRFQRRAAQACQVWRVAPVAATSTAGYLVTNVSSGDQLTAGREGLEATRPSDSPTGERSWTLQPGNDGTWTLRAGGSTLSVKLLQP